MSEPCAGLELVFTGRVQGVGFRPTLFRLAARRGLLGTLGNSDLGVVAVLEGPRDALEALLHDLPRGLPIHAQVEQMRLRWIAPRGCTDLRVLHSDDGGSRGARIPADLATCPDCLAELVDPDNRRHGYPFINCTACGPRFTIVSALPYDRPRTTMADFALCPACEAEYRDLLDRRYHAEPVACATCGPRLSLLLSDGRCPDGDPLDLGLGLLERGLIVAVKGLGGFHLAVRADRDEAVLRLRRLKGRDDKPLAVLVRDLETARQVADIDEAQARLLGSPAGPIVLLPRRPHGPLARQVAPASEEVGLMLPYTPLHHLLAHRLPLLVMTSGNRSEEPIVTTNAEARMRLRGLCDAILDHDRNILVACEDSVIRPSREGLLFIRRSRGYVPDPLPLPRRAGRLLATGGHMKATFCLSDGEQAFVSAHLGDLDSPEGWDAFLRALDHLQRLLRIRPETLVHDAHPDYLTTRFAEASGVRTRAVQHHHAHAAAVLGEHRIEEPALGLILDGTGFGADGTIWGGELLFLPDPGRFTRIGSFRPYRLAGGDRAVKEPWRSALGVLFSTLGQEGVQRGARLMRLDPGVAASIQRALAAQVATSVTTSCGRLFDAVAALAGLSLRPTYEGQPAMELEQLALKAGAVQPYPIDVCDEIGSEIRDEGLLRLDPAPLLERLLSDLEAGEARPLVAARFHLGLGDGLSRLCVQGAAQTGTRLVALGGGCFQNRLLVEILCPKLRDAGLKPLLPRRLPSNDGGLSYGQTIVNIYKDNCI